MDKPWFPKLDDKLRKRVGLVGKTVLVFMAAVGILFFGDALGRFSGYWDAQHERHANHYQNETTNEVRRCLARPEGPASVQKCVEDAVKASHENQRDERDLSAQRQMAKWAWWLLIVTAVQAPLTALGLLFILITIWQGREALTHARETTAIEMRPWIDFTIDVWKIERTEGGGFQLSFTVKLRNLGKTPALRVRTGAEAGCLGDDAAVQRFFASGYTTKGASERTILPNSEGADTSYADLAAKDVQLFEDGDDKAFFPHVSINVAYTWAGSDEGGLTSKCFVVGPPDESTNSVFGIAEDQKFPMKGGIAIQDRGFSHAT